MPSPGEGGRRDCSAHPPLAPGGPSSGSCCSCCKNSSAAAAHPRPGPQRGAEASRPGRGAPGGSGEGPAWQVCLLLLRSDAVPTHGPALVPPPTLAGTWHWVFLVLHCPAYRTPAIHGPALPQAGVKGSCSQVQSQHGRRISSTSLLICTLIPAEMVIPWMS